MIKRIYEITRKKLTGEWRKYLDEKPHKLKALPRAISVIKLRKLRCVCLTVYMADEK
jgi:hypothetical protein